MARHDYKEAVEDQLGERFGVRGWTVEVRALRISCGNSVRKLEPKVMELLVCLASRPGEVLTRRELEDCLWGSVVVGYGSLIHAVTKLRQAFDDDIRHPRVIETVPKVGYRLIADVEPGPPPTRLQRRYPSFATDDLVAAGTAAPAHAGSGADRRGPLGLAAAALGLALLAAGAVGWLLLVPMRVGDAQQGALSASEELSIGILPIVDLSDEPRHANLAPLFTELVITGLARFPELSVARVPPSLVDEADVMPVREFVEGSGIRYVVGGSLQRSGNRVRVMIRLVDVIRGGHVWGERFERELGDLFRDQSDLARTVVATLHGQVLHSVRERTRDQGRGRLTGYEYVQRAARLYGQYTREALREAQGWAERALAMNPAHVAGHRVLTAIYGMGHRTAWLDMTPEEALRRARQTAERALTIDPSDYNAHWAAGAYYSADGDHERALQNFEKALELNPNNSFLLRDAGDPLVYMGRVDEGIALYERAMRLNPYHPPEWHRSLAWAQYAAGRCREALRAIRNLTPLPALARCQLAAIYVCLGRTERAAAEIDQFLERAPGYTLEHHERLLAMTAADRLRRRALEDLRVAGLPEGPVAAPTD